MDAVESPLMRVTVAELELKNEPPPLPERVGAVVSTIHVYVVGAEVLCQFPAASLPITYIVWLPSEREERTIGETMRVSAL